VLGTMQAVVEALVGIWLITGALQAYLPLVGHLKQAGLRFCLIFAGLAIALPDLTLALPHGPDNTIHLFGGIVFAAAGLLWRWKTTSPHA